MNFVKLLVTAVMLALGSFSYAQELNCNKFQYGDFYSESPETGRYEITREGDIQVENVSELGIKIQYKVNWLSPCRYTLQIDKVLKNKPNAPMDMELIITIEVTETGSNFYKYVATSNKYEIKVEGIVYKK